MRERASTPTTVRRTLDLTYAHDNVRGVLRLAVKVVIEYGLRAGGVASLSIERGACVDISRPLPKFDDYLSHRSSAVSFRYRRPMGSSLFSKDGPWALAERSKRRPHSRSAGQT